MKQTELRRAEEKRETANNFLNKSQNNNNKRNSQPITPLGQVTLKIYIRKLDFGKETQPTKMIGERNFTSIS